MRFYTTDNSCNGRVMHMVQQMKHDHTVYHNGCNDEDIYHFGSPSPESFFHNTDSDNYYHLQLHCTTGKNHYQYLVGNDYQFRHDCTILFKFYDGFGAFDERHPHNRTS